jgi:predicted permease
MSARRVWIRALLALYPEAFRKTHAPELLEMYSNLEGSLLGTSWDLLQNAFRVRLEDVLDGRRARRSAPPETPSGLLDGLRQDLKSATRVLRSRPLFSALFVATLALGIGANTAIFTVVNWVVLRPLPFPDADDVVRVFWRADSFNQRIIALFQERATSFSGISGYSGWGFTLVGEGEPEELSGAVVSTNHFSVLGVRPLLGRGFAPEEGEPGRAEVCILSEGLWRRRFGADRKVLGRRIRLAGAGRTSCTVIGVVSDAESTLDAFGPRQAFLPLVRAADLENDDSWFLSVVARLKPGVDLESASAEVKELSGFVRETMYPRTSEEEILGARVERLKSDMVGGEVRGQLLLLMFAVAVVLISACFNLSTLLLARYGEREREMVVRSALGAGRGRVLRQLLTESIVLGLAGGTLGAGLSAAGSRSLASVLPEELPRTEGLAVDGRVLLFALVLSLAASIIAGLLPALRASGESGALALRRGAASGSPSRQRFGRGLVALEIAASLVLLTAACLMIDSFVRLSRTDPGFDAEETLVVGVAAPDSAYPEAAQTRQLFRALHESLASIPGVDGVGSIHILPLDSSNWDFPLYPEGSLLGPNETPPRANFRVVSPGYFRAMGIPLLEGRELAGADREGSSPVGVVNASFARAIFPGESAVGKDVRLFRPDGDSFEIVGVVGDVRQHGLAVEPRPEMYRPFEQWTLGRNEIVLRSSVDPGSLASSVRRAVAAVDPNLPIARLSPMSEIVAGSLATSRVVTLLVGSFAGLALVLAAVGVYGVASSIAGSRRREIGIRMALGSSSSSVLRRVLRSALAPLLPGLLAGFAGSRAVSGLLVSLVPNLSPSPPSVLLLLASFLAGLALVACYLPARRASRVDPMAVLRLE